MCRLGMAMGVRRIRINHAGCLNLCEYGPTMVIYPDAVWYRYQTEADIEEILRRHVIGGKLVDRLRLDIDPDTLHG
jgi:(2Fe-2S) ferredoxin